MFDWGAKINYLPWTYLVAFFTVYIDFNMNGDVEKALNEIQQDS